MFIRRASIRLTLGGRALRPISVHRPDELRFDKRVPWVADRDELCRPDSVFESRQFIIANNVNILDSARETGKSILVAAKVAPKLSVRATKK